MFDPASEPSPVPVNVASDATGDEPRPSTPAAAALRPVLPIERLGAFIEVLLCSGFPTQILIFGALSSLGLSHETRDGGWSPLFVIVMSLTDMVVVLGLVWLFLRSHRESVAEFVMGRRRAMREAALGIALIPAAFMLVILVLGMILVFKPELHNVAVNPFERMLQTPRDAAAFAFVAMFAGGLREEVQRAFIIRRFDQYLGGGAAGIVIYSVVFGLGHVEQGYAAAIATGMLGAAWGCLYWWRGSIIAPVVSHAGFNLAQLLKYVSFAAR